MTHILIVLTYIIVNIWTWGICQVLSLEMPTTNCIWYHKTYTMWFMLIGWNILNQSGGQESTNQKTTNQVTYNDGDFSG